MEYRITGQDLGQVGLAPSDWLEASLQPAMNYTSLDEALSEKFRMAKTLLANLNPGIRDWSTVRTDQPVTVRSPGPVRRREPAARLEIDCTAYRLRVYDAGDRLIASFPCSVARSATQIPVGDFTLGVFAPNPNYTWDPANFPESARAQEIGRRLILPPGPNNPVGRYWLSLSRPGFGIHGTPHPETIGRAESHGCFRMTNWDIETLASLARPGLPVHVRSASIPAPSRPPGADAP
jgi:lipoprotein-anchoring transpeptidase ErfK/SrfK